MENTTNKEYSAERCNKCLYNKLEYQEEINKDLAKQIGQINKRLFIALLICLFAIIIFVSWFLLIKHGDSSYTNINQTGEGTNTITTDSGEITNEK